MGRIFDMNNKFFSFMSKVADLCILNIICVICCIPVITARCIDHGHVLCDTENGT